MAKGKKTGGRDWLPGERGGPGRPPVDKKIRELKKINREFVEQSFSRFFSMDQPQIEAMLEAKTCNVFEATLAAIFLKAIKEGDPSRLNFLLERVVGKVPTLSEVKDTTERKDALKEVPEAKVIELLKAVGNGS
jgi:hypothetical protein